MIQAIYDDEAVKLIFPMISSRSHDTKEYNLMTDGNLLYHLSVFKELPNTWIVLPKTHHVKSDFGENDRYYIKTDLFKRFVGKYYPNINLIFSDKLIYFENASSNRENVIKENSEFIINLTKAFTKHRPIHTIFDFPDLHNIPDAFAEFEHVPLITLNMNTPLKFNTYKNFKRDTVGPVHINYMSIDSKILSDITRAYDGHYNYPIVVDVHHVQDRVSDITVQRKVISDYIEMNPEYMKTISEVDRNFFNSRYKLFFPMRASDKAYDVQKVVELAEILDWHLYVCDPNGTFRQCVKDLKNDLKYSVLCDIPKNKALYYMALDSNPVIPYFEDPTKLIHPGYLEMKAFNVTFIGH